jgi:uncharacterized protein YbcI
MGVLNGIPSGVHPHATAEVRSSMEGQSFTLRTRRACASRWRAAGHLRSDISTAIVGIYKEHFGKGPTRCRTYLEPDLVVVILGEGYTPGERTLFEAGRWYEVRSARQIWQDSMQERFVTTIEDLTGRGVAAFLSANRQDPDLAVEIFLLESDGD